MKQRLIDANEFAIEEPKLWDWSSIDGISSTAVLKQCIWDVQCAPTVDAIPIEWIKSWAMKNWVKSKNCEFDIIVSKLIDDWMEKDNGRSE